MGRLVGVLLVVAGLLIPATSSVAAQDQTATLRSDVDTTLITLGDPIRLLLWVDHDPELRVVWPEEPNLSPFELLTFEVVDPVEAGTTLRSRATYTVTAFELGDLELPELDIVLQQVGGGEVVAELSSDRFGIQVASVGATPEDGLRDIRGPRSIPRSMGRVVAWVFGLLVLALGVVVLLRRWLANRERPVVPAAPIRPVHELALEALDALEESPLLGRGDVKEYHIRLSEIVRNYLEGQFHVPALERTTAEVVHDLRLTHLDRSQITAFGTLLSGSDLVKFAKHRPDSGISASRLDEARRLISESWMAASVEEESPEGSEDEPEEMRDPEPGGESAPEDSVSKEARTSADDHIPEAEVAEELASEDEDLPEAEVAALFREAEEE